MSRSKIDPPITTPFQDHFATAAKVALRRLRRADPIDVSHTLGQVFEQDKENEDRRRLVMATRIQILNEQLEKMWTAPKVKRKKTEKVEPEPEIEEVVEETPPPPPPKQPVINMLDLDNAAAMLMSSDEDDADEVEDIDEDPMAFLTSSDDADDNEDAGFDNLMNSLNTADETTASDDADDFFSEASDQNTSSDASDLEDMMASFGTSPSNSTPIQDEEEWDPFAEDSQDAASQTTDEVEQNTEFEDTTGEDTEAEDKGTEDSAPQNLDLIASFDSLAGADDFHDQDTEQDWDPFAEFDEPDTPQSASELITNFEETTPADPIEPVTTGDTLDADTEEEWDPFADQETLDDEDPAEVSEPDVTLNESEADPMGAEENPIETDPSLAEPETSEDILDTEEVEWDPFADDTTETEPAAEPQQDMPEDTLSDDTWDPFAEDETAQDEVSASPIENEAETAEPAKPNPAADLSAMFDQLGDDTSDDTYDPFAELGSWEDEEDDKQ